MFSKLIKYDLRAIIKYWWIAAVSSVILAVVGGVSLRTVLSDSTEYLSSQIFSVLGIVFSSIGIFLFVALSEILILVRFYKNFFSDEGYLTFTLPVKKSCLLNSKLLSSMIMLFVSTFIFFADVLIFLSVGAAEQLFTPEFFKGLLDVFRSFFVEAPAFNIALVLEIIAILIVLSAIQTLVLFICITIAALVAKKHKVLAAIGIYYVASSIFGFISQILFIPNIFYIADNRQIPIERLIELIGNLPQTSCMITVLIALLGLLAVSVLFAALFWLLEYRLLDRKLNLE